MKDTNKVSLIIIVVILKEVTFRNGNGTGDRT